MRISDWSSDVCSSDLPLCAEFFLADPSVTARRPMSRALLAVLTRCGDASDVPLGRILADLGDRSFGWSILVFGLLNMMPIPNGSNMITRIPPLLLTAQMEIGRASGRDRVVQYVWQSVDAV